MEVISIDVVRPKELHTLQNYSQTPLILFAVLISQSNSIPHKLHSVLRVAILLAGNVWELQSMDMLDP